MGFARFVCPNSRCPHTKKVCFSCKSRFCPTCGKKATDQWIATQRETLPNTTWQHITFTMPSELWEIFAFNRNLLKHLSRLAANTVNSFAAKRGILPGIFTALHTFGRDLKWNVHVHLSTTCGGLSHDGDTWKSLYFPKNAITPMWRYAIISFLRQSYNSLILSDSLKNICPNFNAWSQWLDAHYQKSWIVHFARTSKNHLRNVNYLGRYIKRPPLSQSRLKHYDGKTVAFDYLDHQTGKHRIAEYDTETFIDRFIAHIPDKHFRMINFYGFLANRVKRKLLPKVYELLGQKPSSVKRIRYSQLQKQSFGTDPLQCILCGCQMTFNGITRGKTLAQLHAQHKNIACAKIVQ